MSVKKQRVILTKLKDCEDPRHADHIQPGFEKVGYIVGEPEVGKSFIIGPYWATSAVQEIIDENTFRTLNSIYRWEKLKENS